MSSYFAKCYLNLLLISPDYSSDYYICSFFHALRCSMASLSLFLFYSILKRGARWGGGQNSSPIKGLMNTDWTSRYHLSTKETINTAGLWIRIVMDPDANRYGTESTPLRIRIQICLHPNQIVMDPDPNRFLSWSNSFWIRIQIVTDPDLIV